MKVGPYNITEYHVEAIPGHSMATGLGLIELEMKGPDGPIVVRFSLSAAAQISQMLAKEVERAHASSEET